MNTPAHDDPGELRYAEYVLGVLEADERAAVEREAASSGAASAAVAFWQRRLLPLAEAVPPESPPARLWQRIRAALEFDAPAPRAKPGLWENLRLWHWLTLGSGALLAAACAALIFIAVSRPPAPAIPYMAATLSEHNGAAGWTATMDIGKSRMIVVPAMPQAIPTGHSPELWLIPHGGRPIAVGLISAHAPITLELSASLVGRLGPTARLAVSIEPHGGSPTGQPTGPVIAAGAIGAAAGPATAMRLVRSARRPV
ncbi:MAG: anti-sigma factor [Steroidobacteraceae bacterium]